MFALFYCSFFIIKRKMIHFVFIYIYKQSTFLSCLKIVYQKNRNHRQKFFNNCLFSNFLFFFIFLLAFWLGLLQLQLFSVGNYVKIQKLSKQATLGEFGFTKIIAKKHAKVEDFSISFADTKLFFFQSPSMFSNLQKLQQKTFHQLFTFWRKKMPLV